MSLYNPPQFKSENLDEAFELMERNPFATVISVAENRPFFSHLPLTPIKRGDRVELIGHMARANPHWKHMTTSQVTAIFHGPHTYITPKWYAKNDVPTWNYSVVHVRGQMEWLESYDDIVDCLKTLSTHAERQWPSGWEFFIPDDLPRNILPKSIVGFRIAADEIAFKKKLSQNRSRSDRTGVMRGLEARTDEQSRSVLADMLRHYSLDRSSFLKEDFS